MNIVLLEPEIPSNTGNIGRTCLLTNSKLHLIEPLGFSMDDKSLKRAGLDYWCDVDVKTYESLEELYQTYSYGNFYYATTKTDQKYTDINFKEDDFIIFGKESKGIPEEVLNKNSDYCIKIPMKPIGRSLNLANSVAIILYEAIRQFNFSGLEI